MMPGPYASWEVDLFGDHRSMPTGCGQGVHTAGEEGSFAGGGGYRSQGGGTMEMKGVQIEEGHTKLSRERHNRSPGNTCHQCRQPSTNFPRGCKGYRTKGRKGPCTIRYCGRCLVTRYGIKEGEVPMDGWICPKCTGICNCSICRKKKGEMPTGKLIRVAKARGYTSAHDFLQKNPKAVFAARAPRSISSKGRKRDKGSNASANDFHDQGAQNMGVHDFFAHLTVPRKKRTKRIQLNTPIKQQFG